MTDRTPNPYYAPENAELAAYYGIPASTVDRAITEALEQASAEDGAQYRDLNPLIWNRIGADVEVRCQQAAEVHQYDTERGATAA